MCQGNLDVIFETDEAWTIIMVMIDEIDEGFAILISSKLTGPFAKCTMKLLL